MTPTMQYAVEAALREFLAAPGELTSAEFERTLTRNALAIVTADVAKAGADCEEATSKAFGNGVDGLLAAIRDDDSYALRRRAGTGEPELTFTYGDIEQIAEEAFTE